MKHVNDHEKVRRQSRWTRYATTALSALTIAILATACGNKDGGGGGGTIAVAPGVGTSCVGCPTSTSLIASGLARAYQNQAELALNFYADAAAVSGAQAGNSLYYRGPVVVGGVLRVRVAKTDPNGCLIPAGDYTVTTDQAPGQWYGQQHSNMNVVASGPTVLRLKLTAGSITSTTPAAVDWAGATFPYRYMSYVYVESALGGHCNLPAYPGQYDSPEYYFVY